MKVTVHLLEVETTDFQAHDEEIEEAVGREFTASGTQLSTGARDLSFEFSQKGAAEAALGRVQRLDCVTGAKIVQVEDER